MELQTHVHRCNVKLFSDLRGNNDFADIACDGADDGSKRCYILNRDKKKAEFDMLM